MSQVTKTILRRCQDFLASHGFSKHAGQIYTLRLTPSDPIQGWLGLNHVTHSGTVDVNPVVGVRHEEVERAVAELLSLPPTCTPTVSTHLGYVTPVATYAPWVVDSASPERIHEYLEQIPQYGIPFMRSADSLEAILRLLESGQYGFPHEVAYRLPVVAMFMGPSTRALQLLNKEAERLGDRTDAAAVAYREFAKRIRERLE